MHVAANSSDPAFVIKAWKTIQSQGIPLVVADSVAFFYNGEARTVSWMGDFNGWGHDKKFQNEGKRIKGSDIWMLKASFPKNARLDYKILVNGNMWLIDQLNPRQQWSGVGANSELRMPLWKDDPIHIRNPDKPRGSLSPDILFTSTILRYQITYNVYRPIGIDNKIKLNYLSYTLWTDLNTCSLN